MVNVLGLLATVLATPIVSPKYCLPGDWRLSAVRNLDEVAQPDNRGQGDAASLAAHSSTAFCQHVYLLAQSEDDGPTTRNHPDWFEGGIQDQRARCGLATQFVSRVGLLKRRD